jgi:hypothetical protein
MCPATVIEYLDIIDDIQFGFTCSFVQRHYVTSLLCSTTALTNILTIGETITIVGNATINATPHVLKQIKTIPSTSPILKTLITSDIMPDISKDIKNENT